MDAGHCRLFLKLEHQNPGGSIKDRIALLDDRGRRARRGSSSPAALIVEATAGNTGLGLALVAALKGYRLLIVVPDKMSQEKIFHLKAMGAEVVMTRSDVTKGHPEYYQDLAARHRPRARRVRSTSTSSPTPPTRARTRKPPARRSGSRWSTTSTPWSCGVGTGGTITGLSRFFAHVSPAVPRSCSPTRRARSSRTTCETGKARNDVGSWLVEGIGEDFIPPVCDLSRVKKAYIDPGRRGLRACCERC